MLITPLTQRGDPQTRVTEAGKSVDERKAAITANADAKAAGKTAAEWKDMPEPERKIAGCMAAVRAAVARAPSHDELFVAIETLLRWGMDAPKPPSEQLRPVAARLVGIIDAADDEVLRQGRRAQSR